MAILALAELDCIKMDWVEKMVINFFVNMKVNCNKVIYDVGNGLRTIHIFNWHTYSIKVLEIKIRQLLQMTNCFFAYQKLRA